MNIAVIGAGITGMTVAYVLARRFTVTLFEALPACGGHARTVDVTEAGRRFPVDTGFIVFNEQNYPNLCRLFAQLGVRYADSDMSFSVSCAQGGYEYSSAAPASMLLSRKWPLLLDILRFNRRAPVELRRDVTASLTVADYVRQGGYSRAFFERYLLPLGRALWSSPADRFHEFPMRFVIEFLYNHGMLSVFGRPGWNGRPVWKYVVGGSREYVNRLLTQTRCRLRVGCPVKAVRRLRYGIDVLLENGAKERFHEAVLACHADQALSVLADPDADEREVLSCFPYQCNEVVLHTDTRVLPRSRRCWASWNYCLSTNSEEKAMVTYNMNRLQALTTRHTYCVSVNPGRRLAADSIVKRLQYAHPQYTVQALAARERQEEFARRRRVSLCGAYWGYGFHEDGVNSALMACKAYGMDLDSRA